jgi:hypothetical protein
MGRLALRKPAICQCTCACAQTQRRQACGPAEWELVLGEKSKGEESEDSRLRGQKHAEDTELGQVRQYVVSLSYCME